VPFLFKYVSAYAINQSFIKFPKVSNGREFMVSKWGIYQIKRAGAICLQPLPLEKK
jgi:hypothetical protein